MHPSAGRQVHVTVPVVLLPSPNSSHYTVDLSPFLSIIHPVINLLKKWQQLIAGLIGGVLTAALILLLNRPATGAPITLLPPPATITPVPLRVHITGAVNAPGLYALAQNSILQNVIDAAGGLTAQADSSGLNLAQLITDGDQILIPTLPPTVPPTPTLAPTATTGPGTPTPTPEPTPLPQTTQPANASNPTTNSGALVNLNTATLAELVLSCDVLDGATIENA